MHFHLSTALLLTSSLLADAVPYKPRDGILQRQRRRLIDYPVDHARPVRADMPVVLNKRSTPTYSVVQVDGSSQATATSPAETILATVTAPAVTLAPATETLFYTATQIISGSPATQTIVVTPTPTSSRSSSTTTVAPAVETIYRTVAPAPSFTSSSTQYYDDGLWHTYYPVKTAWDWSSWKTTATSSPASSTPTATAMTQRTWIVRRGDLHKRRVPADIQVANWELTRTEERGVARFR